MNLHPALLSRALGACALLLSLAGPARAVTFTVNSNADLPDADLNNPAALASNGLTTLRAAIMQANKTPGHDIINILGGIGDITLNRGQPDNDGQGTNDEASGDLDITGVIVGGATQPANTTNLNNLTINGAAGGSVIQAGTFTAYPIDGGGSINTDRVLDIGQDGIFGGGFGGSTGISVTLTNLTLRNGNVREALNTALGGGNRAFGGAIRYDGFGIGLPHGTLTLTNCTINNNQADNAGGGVNAVTGTLNVDGCTFSNNITKAGEGGGLFFGAATSNSNVTITNSNFTANEARQGVVFGTFTANADGGGLRINADPNTVTITNTNFTNNIAQEDGGAIKTLGASVTVTGGTITGNTARRHGGAIFGDQDTAGTGRSFTISGATLRNNTANSDSTGGGDGGAIFRDRGVLNITNCTIGGTGAGEPNTATNGGGVAHAFTVDSAAGNTSNQTTVTINGGSIIGNTASGEGGGVYFNAQTFDINASTLNLGVTTPTPVASNTTTNNGGGVSVVDANAVISGSTISGNTANNGGGLAQRQIGVGAPTITLRSATISGNNARLAGGGLHLNGAAITTTHVTLANNRADSDNNGSGNGGGVARVAGTTTLNNTLVGANFRGAGTTADDVNGAVTGNNSLIGNTTGATIGGSGNVTGVDPRLGPLQNNGGVAVTHQLLGGSPALDAGSAGLVGGLTTDQRGAGFTRLKDAGDADTTDEADIGAYEAHPAVEDITDKTTNEDTAMPPFVFNFGDTDLPISSITATSSNTALVPNANIGLSGSGASRTLNIMPVANLFGTTTITVTVSGTENAVAFTSSDTFVLTVNPVNDVPSFTQGADQTVLEDAGAQTVNGWATALSAGPANEAAQALDFLVSSNNSALFSAQPAVAANGTLTYTPAANANGSATVTVQIHDNGGTTNGGVDTSSAQTFVINVTPVNDVPSFTKGADQTVNEDAGAQTVGWATALSAGPANEAGQVLDFIVSNDNNALFSAQPAVAANGTLTFTSTANAGGSATVTVQIRDNGGILFGSVDTSAAQTFVITILAVNDEPTLAAIGDPAAILEDAAQQMVNLSGISAGGGETQTLTVTATSNNTALIPHPSVTYTSANATGSVAFTPQVDQFGSAVITVTVTDNGATGGANDNTVSRTFTVNVTAVNDAPTLDASANPATIPPSSSQQTVNLTGISTGGGESQTLVITATSDNTSLIPNPTVNYTSPAPIGSLTYTPVAAESGSALITVTVNDGGGTANGGVQSVVRTFTVNVGAPTSAPQITDQNPVSTPQDTPRTIGFGDLLVTDSDSTYPTGFTLTAMNGTNYTRNGNTITPGAGYTGPLTVPVKVNDGANDSNVFNLSVTVAPPVSDPTLTALYSKGDAIPGAGGPGGIPAGALFASFGIPAINDNDTTTIAFLGKYKSDAGSGAAIFAGPGSAVSAVARLAATAPDATGAAMPGVTFQTFKDPVLARDGSVAFLAKLAGTGVTTADDNALFTNTGGTLRLVAREGSTLPGTPAGAQVKSFTSASLSSDGGDAWVLFTASLVVGPSGTPGPGGVTRADDTGAWRWKASTGVISNILREGGVLSGVSTSAVKGFRLLRSSGGSPGQSRGQYAGQNATFQVLFLDKTQALVDSDEAGVAKIFASGEVTVPGVPLATWKTFGAPSVPALAGNGLAFFAQLNKDLGGVTSADAKRLFFTPSAGVGASVKTGEIAPGLGGVAAFSLFKDPVLAPGGNLFAFLGGAKGGALTPATDTGVWFQAANGTLTLAAQEGTQPPDLGAAVQFKSFTSVATSDKGPLFVAKLLVGPGSITTANDTGLWGAISGGTVRKLVAEGDTVDTKIVKSFTVLQAASGSQGVRRSFATHGTVIVRLSFTDASSALYEIAVQ